MTVTRGAFLAWVLAAAFFVTACGGSPRNSAGLLQEELLVDTAVTTRFYRFDDEPKKEFDPARLVRSGLGAAILGAGSLTEEMVVREVGPFNTRSPEPGQPAFRHVFSGTAAMKRVLWEIDAVHNVVASDPGHLILARTAGDITRARQDGKLALVLGLDSGVGVQDLATLRSYHRLGLRKLAVVHAGPVEWANSCFGILGESDRGLSDFGREVVRECNQLGIMLDISHASDETMWAVIRTSEKPVLASHSGARAVTNSVRNLTDEMLRELARKGGVVGIGAYYDHGMFDRNAATGWYAENVRVEKYLSERYADPFQLAAALRSPNERPAARRALGLPEASPAVRVVEGGSQITEVSDVKGTLDHLDYVAKLVGIDHVALGTDIDMRRPDYTNILSQLVSGLVERGYRREEIRKILSGNFLRLFEGAGK